MTARLLFRVAAVVLVLFAAGHTVGFLTFRPETADALAVFSSMNSVHFDFGGSPRTYGGFYLGFGLMVTAYLLFCAVLAWHLSGQAASQPKAIGGLAWAFAVVQLANLALSIRYFFIVPATMSAVIAVCLLWAAWQLRSAPPS